MTIERFRSRNPMSYVGRGHNAMLAAFADSRFGANKTKDNCEALRHGWSAARRAAGADSAQFGSRAEIERVIRVESRKLGCRGAVRETSFSASDDVAASSAVEAASSGDPQPYFDAIALLLQNRPATSSALLTQLDAIVTDAEGTLSGDALDGVYAVASVAAESYQYWVVEDALGPMADSVEAEVQNCNVTAEEGNPCTYDQSGPGQSPAAAGRVLVRAASTSSTVGCLDHLDPFELVAWDTAGAVVGFLTVGPSGVLPAAGGASIAEGVYQLIKFAQCIAALF